MSNTRVRFYRSVQAQLLFWFLILGLVPSMLIGIIAFLNAQNALQNSINVGWGIAK